MYSKNRLILKKITCYLKKKIPSFEYPLTGVRKDVFTFGNHSANLFSIMINSKIDYRIIIILILCKFMKNN